ncbi:MAG: ketoacyl-ACP synthase III [Fimbriimonadaceae bacterium]|nr:ketoacyl-ACP synthase III [Fimbriimonadaceae bacterium]
MTKPRPVGIAGSGFAVPPRRLTNDELAHRVDTSDEWIRSRTGIAARHVLSDGLETSDLAAQAATAALDQAGLAAAAVDAVIVATVSADMPFPNAANLVQAKLGIPPVPCFDLGTACAGYIYGLSMAALLIQAERAETVLLVGADALSKLLDWDDRSTCVLFGDGAGATVLRPCEAGYGLLGWNLGADGTGGEYLKVAPRADAPGGPRYLQMAGREVFKFAVRIQPRTCQAALDEAGITAEQVDWLIPHQANIRIIDAAARGLGIPMDKVYVNVDRYGNTSAASIPLALAEAAGQGLFKRGDNLLLVGFGAGLSWGAAVVRWP